MSKIVGISTESKSQIKRLNNRAKAFKKDLQKICEKHQIIIDSSSGLDDDGDSYSELILADMLKQGTGIDDHLGLIFFDYKKGKYKVDEIEYVSLEEIKAEEADEPLPSPEMLKRVWITPEMFMKKLSELTKESGIVVTNDMTKPNCLLLVDTRDETYSSLKAEVIGQIGYDDILGYALHKEVSLDSEGLPGIYKWEPDKETEVAITE